MIVRLKLTDAQLSAVQCRDWSEDPIMASTWDGGAVLVFDSAHASDLASEVNSASNAEDDHAQILRKEGEFDCARGAAGSSRALCNLMLRILKESAKVVENPGR